MKKMLMLVALFALSACAMWERIEKPQTIGPDGSYSVELPVGWVRAMYANDRILVTRDGLGLQHIAVIRQPIDKAFPRIKKSAAENLLPSELAELQIAEMKTEAEQFSSINVIENAPATIFGRPGFRLHVSFKNERGLVFDRHICGFSDKKGYYLLIYQAPRLHYFDKHKIEFERVVNSFRLL